MSERGRLFKRTANNANTNRLEQCRDKSEGGTLGLESHFLFAFALIAALCVYTVIAGVSSCYLRSVLALTQRAVHSVNGCVVVVLECDIKNTCG